MEISDFAGGAKSLQALIGGSADVVTGSFDHTIQMQAKNQSIVAVVQLGRFPGFALALRKDKAANYTGPKDLKGMKIGVTAPGSSTHFMVLYMMAQAGLKPDDASFIGTGSGGTVVAAVQHGEVDGISNADPMITKLDREGLIKIVADTRTLEGTTKVYGGPYPAAVLYTPTAFIEKNPNTVQALVTAFVRGLKWVQAHNADEIAKMMPEEYMLGDKPLFVEAIKANHEAYSPDGQVHEGRAGNRAEGAQGVRSERSERDDRSGEDLHGQVRQRGECRGIEAHAVTSALSEGAGTRRPGRIASIVVMTGSGALLRTYAPARRRAREESMPLPNTSPLRLCVMNGDGISPEIMAATLAVLRAAAAKWQFEFAFDEVEVGLEAAGKRSARRFPKPPSRPRKPPTA